MTARERMEIWAEVEAERGRQDQRWGGPEHDCQHSTFDFSGYITRYQGKLLQAIEDHAPIAERRRRLIQIIALGMAALEHAYDLQEGANGDQ